LIVKFLGNHVTKQSELRPFKIVKMAETWLSPVAPKSLREVQLFLDTLSVDDGILHTILEHPGLRAWCAAFRFDAIPNNIPQSGSQVDATLANIPASGTLLHYDDMTAASMRTLIEAGVPVDETDAGGLTPLFIAVRAGHVEEIFTLLELGSDPQKMVEDEDGWTVVHFAAAEGGSHATLKRLLDGGRGLIDHQSKVGDTAMGASCPETLALLLEYGADMSLKNIHGMDVMESLHYMLDEGDEGDLEFIADMGVIWAAEKHHR
jgi:hypothetical protein